MRDQHSHSLNVNIEACASFAGMLASDGRCKTLDAAAEGYVRAEGAGAAWLRCLRNVAGATLGNNRPVRTRASLLYLCD